MLFERDHGGRERLVIGEGREALVCLRPGHVVLLRSGLRVYASRVREVA
jgi:hypothetical protein